MTLIAAFIASLLAIGMALVLYRSVLAAPTGGERAIEIADAIRAGAEAFLTRQYRTIAMVGVPILLVIWWALNAWYAGGFVVGALASAAAGFIGMNVSVRANLRVAQAAHNGYGEAFDLAFKGGAVTGLMVVGAGLLSLAVIVFAMHYAGYTEPDALIGLAFGGSLISVFARLGGGIFTKAADVGADLVGKLEANIPEDDPRNPAVIADNVGDNVGDCAGMAADLFETYGVTAAAAMLLAHIIFPGSDSMFLYPLLVGAAGIVGSLVAIPLITIDEPAEGQMPAVMGAMYKGLAVASGVMLGLLLLGGIFVDFPAMDPSGHTLGWWSVWLCAVIGAIVTAVMMWVTDYYTGDGSRHVDQIARASETGHATNIIAGLAVGMQATVIPVVVIVMAIVFSYALAGLFGVSVAAMSMLSLAGVVVSIDAYGPITDNAGGIAEMAELPEAVRKVTDPLDAFGNTTKAVTKGYAIASAGLAAVVLFATFIEDLKRLGTGGDTLNFDLSNPMVLAGLFLGAMVPFIFASLAMSAVGEAGGKVVEEVRRQFREIPGIMEGTAKPDYRKCVDIVTASALKLMVAPALIPAVVPVLVGLILGVEALGGLLIGSIVSGVCLALSMTVGGAAWDNAKKFIEAGQYGGKGSEAHKASVTGDTVGDPYKDTAGPAINPMLKLINIVALLIIPFL
ncbi:MAG: sodium-translocating pyrophosphatase [Deltaproteobacteria bacterium]|nr:sodium-translocating pyrophosphatase [Deltaproteobacteria bacterium]MBW2395483.1 sodium-translocating pyrophosphatase [Deltaproteobacteria bacterium]